MSLCHGHCCWLCNHITPPLLSRSCGLESWAQLRRQVRVVEENPTPSASNWSRNGDAKLICLQRHEERIPGDACGKSFLTLTSSDEREARIYLFHWMWKRKQVSPQAAILRPRGEPVIEWSCLRGRQSRQMEIAWSFNTLLNRQMNQQWTLSLRVPIYVN